MSKVSRYLPREFEKSGRLKLIEPPKGKISFKSAYKLELKISMGLRTNRKF